ncbi:MAG: AtpZ/AtpI family protein [Deltaproteobacteria bacterium]|nr:AtpZ/AtpI family protein [Deltaproteobacteria bacterium]MBW2086367.1 AtpZ/AtpI family protein [Deltaproteobacteria bacterium]
MRSGTRQSIKLLALVSTMGISMVLATFIGLGFGYFLDNRVFNTSPWFTLIFLVIGIIAGFRNIYIIAKRAERIMSEDSND